MSSSFRNDLAANRHSNSHMYHRLCRPLEDAMRLAFQEMVFWLSADYGLSYEEAYMLLGQVAEARCTQMVNPKYTYICKVSKHVLEQF